MHLYITVANHVTDASSASIAPPMPSFSIEQDCHAEHDVMPTTFDNCSENDLSGEHTCVYIFYFCVFACMHGIMFTAKYVHTIVL